MQEKQNLTNQQKLEHLKAGCVFKLQEDSDLFASRQRPLYTAVYFLPQEGDEIYQGCIEPSLSTEQAVTLSNSMCRQLVTVSLDLSLVEIL